MTFELRPHQLEALDKIKNGSILAGGTGSGKSITAIAYYYIKVCKGGIRLNGSGSFSLFKNPRDLYIITTAKKRDDLEWGTELQRFLLLPGYNKLFNVNIIIDSWNNIKKYKRVSGAFFIFDEQRVSGSGVWVKTFLDITRKNKWILLSATPGDKWINYIPVFVANGFYKNKTDFMRRHCVLNPYTSYPKIDRIVDVPTLVRHRDDILIPMKFERDTEALRIRVTCNYDKELYRTIWKYRKNPYDNGNPIEDTGTLFYALRRAVNEDPSRIEKVAKIFERHQRIIIFYNFSCELDALRKLFTYMDVAIGEWNGQVHTDIPKCKRWVYLVQYSGAEGWNCITTDTVVFFSQNYSYSITKQAEGRIDRLNTKYKKLYYYYLRSDAPIDQAIHKALIGKKNFNENTYLKNGRKK